MNQAFVLVSEQGISRRLKADNMADAINEVASEQGIVVMYGAPSPLVMRVLRGSFSIGGLRPQDVQAALKVAKEVL